MTILLIEDDENIVDFIKRGLLAEDYGVEVAETGSEGLKLGASPNISLIILDLMLPDLDGRDLCRQLREQGVKTPILMLTAMDSLTDKVEGLRLGADDYLTKPFAFAELLARIDALLRRGGEYGAKPARLVVGDLILDRETLKVERAGRSVQLTAKELALLDLLMSSPGKVVTRAKILEAVWGVASDPLTNIVEVYIRRLRTKLDEGRSVKMIKTLRGFGYTIEPADATPEDRTG